MRDPSDAFRRRLTGLLGLLGLGVAICIMLAIVMTRSANRTVEHLASVELEAAQLARQFRAAVDDLHSGLLRIGNEPADNMAITIRQRRQRLTEWVLARRTAAHAGREQELLQRLATELQSYFAKLDELVARPGGFNRPLERDTILMCDDTAIRLQGMADDFAALHRDELRELLDTALHSVQRLRDLVFLCLALLFAALGVLGALLYRDVVRPLRAQLVESETLLEQREKLAALGTLAAGVAHEIRNPLTAIKARLHTLRRLLTSEEAAKDVESIREEVARLERIVRDVLGYARPADPALNEVELGAWLSEFDASVRAGMRAQNIELTLDAPVTATVRADRDQLRQILLNLVRNAEESFAGRPGRIVLSLQRERTELKGKSMEAAILSVTDDGPGIPAEIQPRLFDPFFTTKAAGTGLGLSIVGRLVENQAGEIVFQTAPRAGTRFSVRLPIAGNAAHRRRA